MTAYFSAPELIAKKRDGHALSTEEIRDVVKRYSLGQLPEEQMSALAMAIYFRGMGEGETVAWTEAMLHSGERLSFQDLGRPVVDKHSTGGVGDKVSLMLAPLAAACGLTVPMISGRGLGHTGGTLDKLEAIPGFSCDLSPQRLREVLAEVGCAIVGANAQIAPADKRFYALRDVTGTVPSIPIIVGSIMSKKLAEGLDALVLDVKVGSAAFMRTFEDARELADRMIAVGAHMGVKTAAVLTRMEEPLGRMIGNACEVAEAMAILRGAGDPELTELTLQQASVMVAQGFGLSDTAARAKVEHALTSGEAYRRFEAMIAAQGGRLSELPSPTHEIILRAGTDGYVSAIDGLSIAQTLVRLKAGRAKAGDAIDVRVGVRIDAPVGKAVCPASPVATLFVGELAPAQADIDAIRQAFTIGEEAPEARPLILEWRGLTP